MIIITKNKKSQKSLNLVLRRNFECFWLKKPKKNIFWKQGFSFINVTYFMKALSDKGFSHPSIFYYFLLTLLEAKRVYFLLVCITHILNMLKENNDKLQDNAVHILLRQDFKFLFCKCKIKIKILFLFLFYNHYIHPYNFT